ncbi:amidase family protein [Brevibacterium sp. 91QC2O2]|uniref:amidase n=1 Tax=Brevibacterium sp. 91QC2O2 TaxID=2968458 RepID=UPI00211D081A|nr:amidase family protein [Brevibacterium sp. 91QC2O2]MCQ9367991.1 amidase family protein [Brevibacterium sp. 91QC2O2]
MTDDLTWLSMRRLAHLIATGEVSSEEAVRAHFERIDAVNPALNAVITEDRERALAEAREADAARLEMGADGELPALHGVPMTHKDTHETAGMRTAFGSPLFTDNIPQKDSLIIARLRAAGIITTGKTNVPELAAGSHTFNQVFGTTVNPYDRSKSASGSSGGVGAVIAAGIQAAGDGSDMGGSLRTPGSFNNVVGFRPSNGFIPHALPGDPWAWLAQSGFMAREIGDVALLMNVASGPHRLAPQSQPPTDFDLPEFALDADYQPNLAGVQIGFAPDLGGRLNVEAEVAAVVGASQDVFAELGAELTEECINLSAAAEVFRVQRAYDFAALYGQLLKAQPEKFKDFVAWNIQMGLDLGVEEIIAKDKARGRLLRAVDRFFADHDVLVTTTSQVLPFDASIEYPTQINGVEQTDYLDWMRAATLISPTGCPSISVPAGFSEAGLPVGIQIVGKPGADVKVLQVAHAFEAATGHAQRHPTF